MVFNKIYEKNQLQKKKKNSIYSKVKSLFEWDE
jgi:hypothetical protein